MSKLHSLAIPSLVVAAAATSLALLGCGGGGPPPRPTEVPMDPITSGSSASSGDPSTTAATT
ncbi:MAG: hypothetical protein ABI183_25230, partial [Polyangiaceae bacterium]